MVDPIAEDEITLRDAITNLVFEWQSEVAKMPRGKTISFWVDEEIMQLISAYTTNKIILELEEMLSHAREHTITDIEMVMHHSGNTIDFIEGVDTRHFENRLAELRKTL